MFKRLTPVITVALLSGCTLTKSEQYHQEALTAIKASETNFNHRLSDLELKLSTQSDDIDVLQGKVNKLTLELSKLRKNTSKQLPKPKESINLQSITSNQATPTHQIVLGSVERVTIDSIKQTFDAQIDTASLTSSLNVSDLEEFERNGEKWIRFHLKSNSPSQKKENFWIEAPILRFVKARKTEASALKRLPVVELWVRVGKIHEKAQFTVSNDKKAAQPILLGKAFIRDIAVVDVSRQYIQTKK
ncbi:ATP-dependent zinc protease family protein [Vibrio sagamiensis]|uniref:ATP-dependent Zn protease n=1 Tax=Vibrio sagamiensis NBRC 104589 TaxID=1219064 RepID=A0A511QCA8_9VIBR|nr:ATP-dependent zinc protease [Vibrio sagamiensis]PNQ65276.1 ATP-dependent Zn protease [Vibrio agarivorans]GEM74933.1 ATP-dependent Zn protease [Vibrio sagamiensis NBRC 104589]